jgi:hypothetical protein
MVVVTFDLEGHIGMAGWGIEGVRMEVETFDSVVEVDNLTFDLVDILNLVADN